MTVGAVATRIPGPRALLAAADVVASTALRQVALLAPGAPVRLQTSPSLGGPDLWSVRGRVLVRPPAGESLAVLGQLLALGVPGAVVGVSVPGERRERPAVCDGEGAWQVDLTPRADLVVGGRARLTCRLLALPGRRVTGPVTAQAEVHVAGPRSQVLLVSDVDDTVLPTGVRGWEALRSTVLTSDERRPPVSGVAALYRDLVAGPSGEEVNPVVYLSASPWTLTDLLRGYLARHGFPDGALELADRVPEPGRLARPAAGPRSSKAERLDALLEALPDLSVVLVGDSGQHDAEVYAEAVRRRPGRVRAVALRRLGPLRGSVAAALADVRAAGVPVAVGVDGDGLRPVLAAAGLVGSR